MRQRSIFDIVGPVMIGPSSSHTAGAVRLGNLARAIFGAQPTTARIFLYGSFASAGKGHGTDLAIVAGLLALAPDDPRIRDAMAEATTAGMSVDFGLAELGDAHPNTAVIELSDAAGRTMRIVGSSLGGGDVVITEIDGFDVEATGELPMLVIEHEDRPGEIAAVTSILAEGGANIAAMRVSREVRGGTALMLIETDAAVDTATLHRISQTDAVRSVRSVPAV
jgi:L-serine dehydratase